ncbi:hypothetical protein, partial [Kitasatospora sp. NPDC093558]|uniref:hypothetical protein n=1 Tax=Kitasatospora sp. NPDC093558 TaxID=3155201 RepID=UPI0034450338
EGRVAAVVVERGVVQPGRRLGGRVGRGAEAAPSAAADAERDRSAGDRLRAWLERRDKVAPADRRTVARPERFRLTPGAALPERPSVPAQSPRAEAEPIPAEPDSVPTAQA